MTLEQFAIEHLIENFLTEENAKEIIALAKSYEVFDGTMINRWGESVEGYPELMRPFFLNLINIVALEWVKQNKPKAFYRPLFEM